MTAPRLAVLASGAGTTLENLFESIASGALGVEIAVVVASREDALALDRARRRGVPAFAVPRAAYADDRAHSAAVVARLAPFEPALVAMAGYLHLLHLPPSLRGRVMNIHPALLPAFGGRGFFGSRVHRAVLDSGAKVSGCTVHYASDAFDAGPIILQRTVPVLDDDTPGSLAARVFVEECAAYPEAISLHLAGRLRVEGNRVRILPAPGR